MQPQGKWQTLVVLGFPPLASLATRRNGGKDAGNCPSAAAEEAPASR